MKATKDEARKAVDVYGNLLMERAIISDIASEEVRGQQRYEFEIFDAKYNYPVQVHGVKELATVLTSMWSAYSRARHDLGIDNV